MRTLILLSLAANCLWAQSYPGGQYPGGQYPGGQYPGGTRIPGIGRLPIPGQRRPPGTETIENTYAGRLLRMDSRTISIETREGERVQFERTRWTRFYRANQEIRNPGIAPGTQVTVEASASRTSGTSPGMAALNVYIEGRDFPGEPRRTPKPAEPEEAEPAEKDPEEKEPEAPKPRPRAETRRPAPEEAKPAPKPPAARPAPPAPAPAPAPVVARRREPPDALLLDTQRIVAELARTRPAYSCAVTTKRSVRGAGDDGWRNVGEASAELVYANQQEEYRNQSVSRAGKGAAGELPGHWPAAEFAPLLDDLFTPAALATFLAVKEPAGARGAGKEYEFEVAAADSHWTLRAGDAVVRPAYKGRVWIDPQSGYVLRIAADAVGLGEESPVERAEVKVQYGYLRLIGPEYYLLPVQAESTTCERASGACSQNALRFSGYRKYEPAATAQR
jgi:outer membrane biosynthesis protein TonB